MAVRGRAVNKNHILTLYIYKVISPYFFIMDAYPDHILESTKRIEVKLGS